MPRCALKLSIMLMMRPGAFIRAEWTEVNLETGVWEIEVKHMKAEMMVKKANRSEDKHIVPLPKQAIQIFRELHEYTGNSRYVFQSPLARPKEEKHLNRETVLNALYNMGYKGIQTAHGFRGTASTLLNEMRRPDGSRMWDSDAIEKQLSHKEKNAVRAAYNHGKYLEERAQMLQAWANSLDKMRDGADIIPITQSIS